MQMRIVEKGTHGIYIMLYFVCFIHIPRADVMLICREGLSLEVAIYYFKHISTLNTKRYTSW